MVVMLTRALRSSTRFSSRLTLASKALISPLISPLYQYFLGRAFLL